MKLSTKKAQLVPLVFSLLVMFGTLAVYLLGPVPWIENWNKYEVYTILLLVAYFAAFAGGYLLHMKRHPAKITGQKELLYKDEWTKLLKVTIITNLLITFAVALVYSDAKELFSLFYKAVQGILNPADNYFNKNASSRIGSALIWVNFLYSPVLYLTEVMSVMRFRSLEKWQKVCVVLTISIEAARWLSIGTNKGLFDLVLLFISFFLITLMLYIGHRTEHIKRNYRFIKIIFIAVLVLFVLFFVFFGWALSDRLSGAYNHELFEDFPYSLVPGGLRLFVEKADSYLVQGYDHMEKIIENCKFQWTFGIGNSNFAMRAFDTVFGIDLTGRTYPQQLAAFGVDPMASWHSAYSWFASDLTFIGVIALMFFAGYFLSSLSRDIIVDKEPIAMTLFYLMIMMIVNASCTNYVLAYSTGFAGFWLLMILKFLQKNNIRFSFRNKKFRITKG